MNDGSSTDGLARLSVLGVLAAVRAELVHRKPIRIVAAILLGDVVTVPAVLACQGDLGPDLGGCHDGAFQCVLKSRSAVFRRTYNRSNLRVARQLVCSE